MIIAGAVLSALRLLRARRRAPRAGTAHGRSPALSPARLAAANLLIATGTLVLSAGGLLNSVLDEMDAFAVSLVVGITVIFVGFLLTETGHRAGATRPWHPPAAVARMLDRAA